MTMVPPAAPATKLRPPPPSSIVDSSASSSSGAGEGGPERVCVVPFCGGEDGGSAGAGEELIGEGESWKSETC